MRMSKVLYIGWFGLPETAAGIRVFQIAKRCFCERYVGFKKILFIFVAMNIMEDTYEQL